MEKEEEKNTGSETKKCCSGDCRTFVIALLTSIIVVLAFHGIMLASKCLLKCGPGPAGGNCCCCMMKKEMPCPPPQCGPEKPLRGFKKHHGKHHRHPAFPKPAGTPAPEAPVAPEAAAPAAK